MIERVFVDTSAWYAYINSKDPDHVKVKDYLSSFKGKLISTNFIFDETVTLVLSRMGHKRAVLTGKTLLNPKVVIAVRVRTRDEREAWELFLSRSDKTYSFTDCTSFVIMRRLGIEKSLVIDPHFQQEGFQVVI
ncbi:MAG: Ribonuclease VapC20 [Candidatus Scalindua rubra]|uniref:Ribonuclease VapC20 n=1 Tax=Candidatus Scalindua rubra TaxID=1872076 RepID=A0A1E3X6I0_9BACT|nr:MAG: Ribonuclease VapC20 [Candidatus Scalindua rubra]